MKKIIYALFSCCLLVLAACEKEVEFNAPDTEAGRSMTLNAIAVEGQPLTVYLNEAYSVGKAPLLNIGYQFPLSHNEAISDYHSDAYFKRTVISNAEVQAVVNGQQVYGLTYSKDIMGYVCDYCPQAGDRIEVQAIGLHVETTVPHNPKIEIIEHKVLAENPYKYIGGMSYATDSIMRITCRIPATNDGQYYRLRIRGERKVFNLNNAIAYYLVQDIYFSEDGLFVDNRLIDGFGGWPAYFSNVFDNTMIGRNGRTFTIDSPKPVFGAAPNNLTDYEKMQQQVNEPDIPARVMVELQALSPELYRYLKSVELFRITESDAFSEPVQIYSNVQNGWGILGALSYDRHFLEYGE